jgi:hypothetical protein
MLLAGIQAEFGLDPRLKRSGVTVLRLAFQPQFSKEHAKNTMVGKVVFLKTINFVLFVTFVV